VLFVRKPYQSPLKHFLAKVLLSRVLCRLARGIIVVMPAPGAWRDHLSAKCK
jgi:hypothetical protein